ncbi:MAG: FliH/SctL family protein [Alphaproteobacteria bacterium]|nr:FliH/SctL family protein [Alphaproteobacteria bacterium]
MALERFEFGVSFDDPDSFLERRGRPKEPVFSLQEYTDAQNAARAEGYAQGNAEALAGVEQRTLDALTAINEHVGLLAGQLDGEIDRITKDALQVAIQVIRRLFPSLEGDRAEDEIARLVQAHLEQCLEAPKLVLKVRPDLAEPMRARIGGALETAAPDSRLLVLPDDQLGASECRLEWEQGGVERILGRIWNDIEFVIERAAPGAISSLDQPAEAEETAQAEEPTEAGEDAPDEPAPGPDDAVTVDCAPSEGPDHDVVTVADETSEAEPDAAAEDAVAAMSAEIASEPEPEAAVSSGEFASMSVQGLVDTQPSSAQRAAEKSPCAPDNAEAEPAG